MDIEERLKWILSETNEWLKFAEAKNGVLIVVIGGILIGLLQIETSNSKPMTSYSIILYSLLVAGGIIALISFIPRTTISDSKRKNEINKNDNLLFWGHVKNYSPEILLQTLISRGDINSNLNKDWQLDLVQQVIINARIASWKYTCFRISVWLVIVGIITPIGALFISFIVKILARITQG